MKPLKIFLFVLTFCPIVAISQVSEINQYDSNGKRTGSWIAYYPGGEIKYRGKFIAGKPIDTLERFYNNGKRKAIIVQNNDGLSYSASLFDEQEKIRALGNYLNEKKNGVWSYFATSGNKVLDIEYRLDTLNGHATRYYANGQTMEVTNWINNQLNGVQLTFSDSGQKTSEISYLSGQMDGVFKAFNSSGFMIIYGLYNSGRKDGKWQYFKEDGKADYQLFYDGGKLLNPELMDSLQKISFEKYESNRLHLKDPKNYVDDPFAYIRK